MAYRYPNRHFVKLPAWRRRVLLIAMLMSFAVLLLRGVYLQSVNKEFLQEKGSDRYSRTLKLHAHRGKITDRNGELLAVSIPVETVWAVPADIAINAKQKQKITNLLNIKSKYFDKKVANKKRQFAYIKRRIPPKLAAKVMDLKIPGIFLQREYKRYYPAGDVASHLVGFVGADNNGQEGFELVQNDALSGVEGRRYVIKDRKGRIVEDTETVKQPQDGKNLTLSIDRRIQYLTFRALTKAVNKHKAKAASAVVLDAKTGEVLAMVNLPTYNPNKRINIKGKIRNRAVTDIFEPGSTMKAISVGAAMQFGPYKSSTKIETAPGYITIGSATIRDTHSHGELSVAQVVQKSSNVGSAKMALSLEREDLWNTFNQIGFGGITNIGFPGEVAGKVRQYKTWRPIEQATMSYGHGISVTLLQLARAYTVFANNGELMPVSLVKASEVPAGSRVFSKQVANDVKAMLELVVQPGGTAVKAQVAGYRVAGKTGTAHKLNPNGGGYEDDKYVSSFVGLAPASNPRLIMAVMVDEPSGRDYYGGLVAAPVFSSVMANALRLLGVSQDAPNNNIVITSVVAEDAKEVI